jgi:hypothetical protein
MLLIIAHGAVAKSVLLYCSELHQSAIATCCCSSCSCHSLNPTFIMVLGSVPQLHVVHARLWAWTLQESTAAHSRHRFSMCCSLPAPASTAVVLVFTRSAACLVEHQHSCCVQALISLLLLAVPVYLILSSSSMPSPGAVQYFQVSKINSIGSVA